MTRGHTPHKQIKVWTLRNTSQILIQIPQQKLMDIMCPALSQTTKASTSAQWDPKHTQTDLASIHHITTSTSFQTVSMEKMWSQRLLVRIFCRALVCLMDLVRYIIQIPIIQWWASKSPTNSLEVLADRKPQNKDFRQKRRNSFMMKLSKWRFKITHWEMMPSNLRPR